MPSQTSEKVVIPVDKLNTILHDAARNLRLSVCVQIKSTNSAKISSWIIQCCLDSSDSSREHSFTLSAQNLYLNPLKISFIVSDATNNGRGNWRIIILDVCQISVFSSARSCVKYHVAGPSYKLSSWKERVSEVSILYLVPRITYNFYFYHLPRSQGKKNEWLSARSGVPTTQIFETLRMLIKSVFELYYYMGIRPSSCQVRQTPVGAIIQLLICSTTI